MLYLLINEQQNNNSSASYDEQLKALYDDYKSKEKLIMSNQAEKVNDPVCGSFT